ncbi:low temperature requirement protein A [Salsipaludibacter albus]|uniref:low temperature requirement protein A n=1 Tax=Salsipaludibacter albus TaxID=2849650 RepID=UPI001EE4A54E|nr:low temperature requirement protein A [Salsipaludibacter albus]MBY5161760.1 low temperature requirement protein A [Salsipaludibacter albus]
MRGLEIPPRQEDFTADPVELFFDLSYVYAFSQLVYRLIHEPTWSGAGRTLLLFMLLWIPWAQFHWSANAVSGNSRTVRAWFLVATVAAIPMGASVTTAYDTGGPVFALSQAVILAMGLLTMIVGLDNDSVEYRSIRSYAVPNWIAMGIVVVGAFLPDPARTIAWVLALLVVAILGMRVAGGRQWIVRAGHFAERHGLIVIIALGEVIVATALGISNVVGGEAEGAAATGTVLLVTLGAAGVFAGLLWWAYFDRPLPAWEHGAEQLEGPERGRFARDVWTLWHVPIVTGVIASAAALEEVTLHPKEPLPLEFRVMLAAGVCLFLGGVAGAVWRAFRIVGWERVGAMVVVAAFLLTASGLHGLWLVLVLDATLAVMLVVESIRVRTPTTVATTA